MYQAKKLGKNQISGNPRPRPALLARRSVAEPEPSASTADAPAGRNGASAPREDRAVAVELAPRSEVNDEEPDPQDVRRQIASASRSFDPDHQIRRAMDAFLSPGAGDRERATPDH
jgi:hypothetical protein